jgi:geranylgeranyl diphosphate synthase type II
MSHQLTEFMGLYGPQLEEALLSRLPLSEKPGTGLFNEAVHYAVFPAGKRMRPLFTLLVTQAVGGDTKKAISIACAIEFFHTCSLIFDDLPAMDNATDRRGKQPLHRVFGEDTAMLASLAFFNQAYAIAGQVCCHEDLAKRPGQLMEELSHCIGPDGMIGGQFIDLRLHKEKSDKLRLVSYSKTTTLMRLMLTTGAMIGGASEDSIKTLAAIGDDLGQAYQMLDDIIDKFEDATRSGPKGARLDGNALWQQASDRLGHAHHLLHQELSGCDPTLLIELTKMVFTKIGGQAASRLSNPGALDPLPLTSGLPG